MKKYDRVAVKVDFETAAKIEAILRESGDESLVEIADKYLAKITEPVKGPRLTKVRSDESRKIMVEVLTQRVNKDDLKIGDACILLGQCKFFVKEVKEEVVVFEKTSMVKGKERYYEKKVADDRYTKIVEGQSTSSIEEVPEEVVETSVEESAKDRKNRIRREKRAAVKNAA